MSSTKGRGRAPPPSNIGVGADSAGLMLQLYKRVAMKRTTTTRSSPPMASPQKPAKTAGEAESPASYRTQKTLRKDRVAQRSTPLLPRLRDNAKKKPTRKRAMTKQDAISSSYSQLPNPKEKLETELKKGGGNSAPRTVTVEPEEGTTGVMGYHYYMNSRNTEEKHKVGEPVMLPPMAAASVAGSNTANASPAVTSPSTERKREATEEKPRPRVCAQCSFRQLEAPLESMLLPFRFGKVPIDFLAAVARREKRAKLVIDPKACRCDKKGSKSTTLSADDELPSVHTFAEYRALAAHVRLCMRGQRTALPAKWWARRAQESKSSDAIALKKPSTGPKYGFPQPKTCPFTRGEQAEEQLLRERYAHTPWGMYCCRYSRFIAWLRLNGAFFPNVSLCRYSENYRGVHVVSNLELAPLPDVLSDDYCETTSGERLQSLLPHFPDHNDPYALTPCAGCGSSQALAGRFVQWNSDEVKMSLRPPSPSQDSTCDIRESTKILKIPAELLITTEVAKQSRIGELISKYVRIGSQTLLGMYLLYERARGAASKWSMWFDVLPTSFNNLPMFSSHDTLNMLKGSDDMLLKVLYQKQSQLEFYQLIVSRVPGLIELFREARREGEAAKRKAHRFRSKRWHEYEHERESQEEVDLDEQFLNVDELKDEELFNLDDFLWGSLAVGTRVFSLTVDGQKTSVLAPLADMMNHKEPAGTLWTFDQTCRSFTLTATGNLNVGDTIYESYGPKCNKRFFASYGFNLPDNPSNEVAIYVRVSMQDVLGMGTCNSVCPNRGKSCTCRKPPNNRRKGVSCSCTGCGAMVSMCGHHHSKTGTGTVAGNCCRQSVNMLEFGAFGLDANTVWHNLHHLRINPVHAYLASQNQLVSSQAHNASMKTLRPARSGRTAKPSKLRPFRSSTGSDSGVTTSRGTATVENDSGGVYVQNNTMMHHVERGTRRHQPPPPISMQHPEDTYLSFSSVPEPLQPSEADMHQSIWMYGSYSHPMTDPQAASDMSRATSVNVGVTPGMGQMNGQQPRVSASQQMMHRPVISLPFNFSRECGSAGNLGLVQPVDGTMGAIMDTGMIRGKQNEAHRTLAYHTFTANPSLNGTPVPHNQPQSRPLSTAPTGSLVTASDERFANIVTPGFERVSLPSTGSSTPYPFSLAPSSPNSSANASVVSVLNHQMHVTAHQIPTSVPSPHAPSANSPSRHRHLEDYSDAPRSAVIHTFLGRHDSSNVSDVQSSTFIIGDAYDDGTDEQTVVLTDDGEREHAPDEPRLLKSHTSLSPHHIRTKRALKSSSLDQGPSNSQATIQPQPTTRLFRYRSAGVHDVIPTLMQNRQSRGSFGSHDLTASVARSRADSFATRTRSCTMSVDGPVSLDRHLHQPATPTVDRRKASYSRVNCDAVPPPPPPLPPLMLADTTSADNEGMFEETFDERLSVIPPTAAKRHQLSGFYSAYFMTLMSFLRCMSLHCAFLKSNEREESRAHGVMTCGCRKTGRALHPKPWGANQRKTKKSKDGAVSSASPGPLLLPPMLARPKTPRLPRYWVEPVMQSVMNHLLSPQLDFEVCEDGIEAGEVVPVLLPPWSYHTGHALVAAFPNGRLGLHVSRAWLRDGRLALASSSTQTERDHGSSSGEDEERVSALIHQLLSRSGEDSDVSPLQAMAQDGDTELDASGTVVSPTLPNAGEQGNSQNSHMYGLDGVPNHSMHDRIQYWELRRRHYTQMLTCACCSLPAMSWETEVSALLMLRRACLQHLASYLTSLEYDEMLFQDPIIQGKLVLEESAHTHTAAKPGTSAVSQSIFDTASDTSSLSVKPNSKQKTVSKAIPTSSDKVTELLEAYRSILEFRIGEKRLYQFYVAITSALVYLLQSENWKQAQDRFASLFPESVVETTEAMQYQTINEDTPAFGIDCSVFVQRGSGGLSGDYCRRLYSFVSYVQEVCIPLLEHKFHRRR